MNIKTTLLLVVVAVFVAVLVVLDPPLLRWLDLAPKQPDGKGAGTLAILQLELTPDKISQVELAHGGSSVVLKRGKNGDWTLPGDWPARELEVNELIARLSSLRSGFYPEPLGENANLAKYGLDHPALTVVVRAGEKDYRLTLGRPPVEPGETNRFSVPTWLRLGEKAGNDFEDKPEVIRLEPGLVAELDQPVEHYRKWRLFPSERVTRQGFGETTSKEDRVAAELITVEDEKPDSAYTLTKVGDDWQLTSPHRDQPASFRLESILTTLPDLWVSRFVNDPKKKDLVADYGLKEPASQAITVRRSGGQSVTLELGKVAPSPGKKAPMPPEFPGAPKPPEEEYRYARVRGSDQVFILPYGKLKQNVLIPFTELRESNVVTFAPADARRVEVERQKRVPWWGFPLGGTEKLLFTYDEKAHKWQMKLPLEADAETSRVDDLLRELSGLRAETGEDVTYQNKPEFGLTAAADRVSVELEEETKTEPKTKRKRSFTVVLGNHESGQDRFYVALENVRGGVQTPRVTRVRSKLEELARLEPREYRGRHVVAFDTIKLKSLEIERKGEKVTLERLPTGWNLTSPVKAEADGSKANMLATQLGTMEAAEFVAMKPDADYGLKTPALTVTATLEDGKQKLLVGKAVEGKPEYYARLDDKPDVFTVSKILVDALDQDSLSYRPLTFPTIPTADVEQVEIKVDKQGYVLKPEATKPPEPPKWTITSPFQATPRANLAQPLVEAAAAPHAERYVAHEASDADLKTKYGLAEPHLQLVVKPNKKETKERTLLVGAVADKDAGTRYARLGDQKAVFVLGKDYLGKVDVTAEALLDPHVLTLAPDSQIQQIESNQGGKVLKLALQEDAWQVSESPAGKYTADKQAVADMLATWYNLAAKRFAAYGPTVDWAKYGLQTPALTASVTTKKDGKQHRIKLGKDVEGADGGVYAQVDEVPGVLVLDPQAAARLRQTYLDYVPHQVFSDELKADDVFKLLMKEGATEVWLEKKDGAWRLVKPQDQKADDPTVSAVLGQLASPQKPLRAKRVAAYVADKLPDATLKEFGLTPAAGEVKLRYGTGEGKLIELQLGKAADDKSGDRFAAVTGRPAVLVLPGDVVRELLSGPLHFRDRAVAAPIRDEVDRVELTRGGSKVVYARPQGTWRMIEPVQQEVDHDEMQDFVDALSRLRADELVAEKPADLKMFGLDQPAAKWKLQVGGKDALSLLVGKPGPDKVKNGKKEGARVLAKVESGDLVFLLDPKLTARATGRFRSRQIFAGMTPKEIHTLRYQYPGAPFVLEKKNDKWEVAGKPGPVNAKAIEETLDALANLRAERFVAEKTADLAAYGLGRPALKLEIQTTKGKRELEIGGPADATGKVYARVLGEDGDVFVLSATDRERIVRQLTAFQQTQPPFPGAPAQP